MDIIEKIRERSREEWTDFAKGHVNTIRIWIEDNGIKASAVALVFGMVLIIFFKLFLFLLVVGGLVGFFIWSVSIPEIGVSKSDSNETVDSDSTDSSKKKTSNSEK